MKRLIKLLAVTYICDNGVQKVNYLHETVILFLKFNYQMLLLIISVTLSGSPIEIGSAVLENSRNKHTDKMKQIFYINKNLKLCLFMYVCTEMPAQTHQATRNF